MSTESENILDKVLITGGDGMVASYIDFGIKANRELFDITNQAQVLEVVKKIQPKVILHLAAKTGLLQCEENPAETYMVNSAGTYNIALAAKMVGAKMIYVSTDAVFSNSNSPHNVDDKAFPGNIYGHSKYLGELAVKGLSNNNIIVRISWVFGGGKEKDKRFVGKFISQIDQPEGKMVNDQFSSPTYARDFANALKDLVLEDEKGIFHIVNSGTASRYDMAVVIAETLHKDAKILPVSASAFGLESWQKSSGGLVSSVKLRPWREALKEYLETEWI